MASVLIQVETAFGIPLIVMQSSKDTYGTKLESGLRKAKMLGAEYCVFGDLFEIPYEDNWNTQSCKNAGIEAVYPLMGMDRDYLLQEFINSGFKTIINAVNTDVLSEDFLGRIIDLKLIEDLRKTQSDICGENGEYYSFVVEGQS